MDRPEWAGETAWRELTFAIDDLTFDFIVNLPTHEFEALRKDPRIEGAVIEQVQQKLFSTLEGIRERGIYEGTRQRGNSNA